MDREKELKKREALQQLMMTMAIELFNMPHANRPDRDGAPRTLWPN